MRYIFLLLLIVFYFPVSAQDDSLDIKYAPTLTGIGKPTGERIAQKIGKDGGKLFSTDGRMELVIPEGAVSSKTNISIQSVVNTLSPDEGDAYTLEPSGINFQKPLQVIFHYTGKEAMGRMPEYKGIAWQDDKGQWYNLDNVAVDTIARTITGNITHFSTWVFFDAFVLKPTTAKLRVGRPLDMFVACTLPRPNTAGGIITDETLPKKIKFTTYADGIRGGNAVVGTVSSVYGQTIRNVKYTAPATVPDQNPVAVSVEATNISWSGFAHPRLKLVSNITIIDKSYEITVIGHNKQNMLQCVITSLDSSSCILQLNGNKTRIQDIQNMNVVITVNGCTCHVYEISPGTSTGPVNIVGTYKINVLPANPPQNPYPLVMLYFIRNMGMIAGMAVDPCMGAKGISVPSFPLQAVPMFLEFEAKDEEQTIMKGGDANNGFEVKVRPAKEQY